MPQWVIWKIIMAIRIPKTPASHPSKNLFTPLPLPYKLFTASASTILAFMEAARFIAFRAQLLMSRG